MNEKTSRNKALRKVFLKVIVLGGSISSNIFCEILEMGKGRTPTNGTGNQKKLVTMHKVLYPRDDIDRL